jgi:hypothetical protein
LTPFSFLSLRRLPSPPGLRHPLLIEVEHVPQPSGSGDFRLAFSSLRIADRGPGAGARILPCWARLQSLAAERLRDFRDGNLTFLFAFDVLSEGVDVPEINLVMFLRPTESLTVFFNNLHKAR